MACNDSLYLPDEIVDCIADCLHNIPRRSVQKNPQSCVLERQRDLRAFSLVCRQWYRVGLKYLYRFPTLWGNDRFSLFMRTVNERSPDLGSKVTNLDLRTLQHQSSPSQTARLINWTKKGLRRFYAPRASFM